MVLMGPLLSDGDRSEPSYPAGIARHWQRVQVPNLTPVIAANRVGVEKGKTSAVTFYGSSFIADHTELPRPSRRA
jgi:N-carbamoylputrescine amidase